ncbi:hypothetical protein JCM16814_34610 [Desulfobaculum senezii]
MPVHGSPRHKDYLAKKKWFEGRGFTRVNPDAELQEGQYKVRQEQSISHNGKLSTSWTFEWRETEEERRKLDASRQLKQNKTPRRK